PAAEQDELLRAAVVAHRRPEEDAAERLLWVRLRGEVLPLPRRRVVPERAAASGEGERLRIRVVVVLLAEGEGAVDGPVRAGGAGRIAEAPHLVLPSGGGCRAKLRSPVGARGELVPPPPGRVEGEHVVGPGLLVFGEGAAAAEDEEPLRDRVVPDRHVPPPALDRRPADPLVRPRLPDGGVTDERDEADGQQRASLPVHDAPPCSSPVAA